MAMAMVFMNTMEKLENRYTGRVCSPDEVHLRGRYEDD